MPTAKETPVNQTEFIALIKKVENNYAGNPDGLARSSLLWMIGGYLFVFIGVVGSVIVLGALAILALFSKVGAKLGIKLVLICGFLCWVVGKGLFSSMPEPTGRRLKRSEAPELWDMIEELRRNSGAPKIDAVLLTSDFNAALYQRPALGIFGWCSNYLILGLPLMHALDRNEMRSVIAHELGHMQGAHGSLTARLSRLQGVWAILGEASFVIRPFASWYSPRLAARSFVLSRFQEHIADAAAVQATSAEVAASALVRVHAVGRLSGEEYWSTFILNSAKN